MSTPPNLRRVFIIRVRHVIAAFSMVDLRFLLCCIVVVVVFVAAAAVIFVLFMVVVVFVVVVCILLLFFGTTKIGMDDWDLGDLFENDEKDEEDDG